MIISFVQRCVLYNTQAANFITLSISETRAAESANSKRLRPDNFANSKRLDSDSNSNSGLTKAISY